MMLCHWVGGSWHFEGTKIIQSIRTQSPKNIPSHPRNLESSVTQTWNPQISRNIYFIRTRKEHYTNWSYIWSSMRYVCHLGVLQTKTAVRWQCDCSTYNATADGTNLNMLQYKWLGVSKLYAKTDKKKVHFMDTYILSSSSSCYI